ncbi:MAG: PilZ domain-containing protein [Phycisphaerales bacterium]
MRLRGNINRPGLSGPANTLRMAQRELNALHAEFESDDHAATAKREHARRPYRHDSLLVEMHQPGGDSTLRYACRDLSAGGASLLHSSYVHVGTTCVVHIPRAHGGTVPVAGRVVRCQFVRGKVHEFGVKFDVPICIHEFVRLDPILGEFSIERADPKTLTGSILHVAPAETDRKLVRHFAEETPLGIVSAPSGAAALARAKEPFNLIVSSIDLGDMRADIFLDALAGAGVATPVLLIGEESSPALIEMARRACAAAMINKPLDRERFLRAVADVTTMRSPEGRKRDAACELPPGDPRKPLIADTIALIRRLGEELEPCTGHDFADRAASLCSEIRSTARSMGFAFIAATAEDALAVLPVSAEKPWPARLLRMLSELCRRAHAGSARAA